MHGVTPIEGNAMLTKVLADFSIAAAAAALIGIVVGGAALTVVWLISVLNR